MSRTPSIRFKPGAFIGRGDDCDCRLCIFPTGPEFVPCARHREAQEYFLEVPEELQDLIQEGFKTPDSHWYWRVLSFLGRFHPPPK